MKQKYAAEAYNLLGGISVKPSPYSNGPTQFRNISNMNFVVAGGLNKRPGTDNLIQNAVGLSGTVLSAYEYELLDGSSYIVANANTRLYSYGTTTGGFTIISQNISSTSMFDFSVLVNTLFLASGNEFLKFNGSTVFPYGSYPFQYQGVTVGSFIVANSTFGFNLGNSFIYGNLGPSLSYAYKLAYGNASLLVGPASVTYFIESIGPTFLYTTIRVPSFAIAGSYAVDRLLVYRSAGFKDSGPPADFAGITFVPYVPGVGIGSQGFANSSFVIVDVGAPTNPDLPDDGRIFLTTSPKYLEIYNNELFMAGFTDSQSNYQWSDIGQPEITFPEFSNEFRSDDGDRITAMKSYQGRLFIFKNRSIQSVSGTDPDNFFFQEITDQYGCLSNRAVVQFQDTLWFLDAKGIGEFDGAKVSIVSNDLEPVFERMNINAAQDNAWAIHNIKDNEVWFGIPLDSSTQINTIIVFDYYTKQWSTYTGVQAASIFKAQGRSSNKKICFGQYTTGTIGYFNPSLSSDFGQAITCSFQHNFMTPSGHLNENIWRRFYMDMSPQLSYTQAIDLRFRTNYQDTIQATRSMYQFQFQSRIDFGLPARSIQVEMAHASATAFLTIHGMGYHYRIRRER